MAIKDILLHLGDDPRNSVRTKVALSIAAKHGAHLTGLYVLPVPAWPATAEGYIPVDLIERMMNDARAVAEKEKAAFLEACRRDAVPAEWRIAEGDPLAVVPEQARYADLTVIGQVESNGGPKPSGIIGLPEEVALNSGRPVLCLPYTGTIGEVGRRILLAWNGRKEATRALHDALPFLQKAEKVIVFSVNPEQADSGSDVDISTHLARHGVKAEARHTVVEDIGIGDVLLDSVSDLNIDLVVMGAYGHSRLRELVMGGVTRNLLNHMTAPILLSH